MDAQGRRRARGHSQGVADVATAGLHPHKKGGGGCVIDDGIGARGSGVEHAVAIQHIEGGNAFTVTGDDADSDVVASGRSELPKVEVGAADRTGAKVTVGRQSQSRGAVVVVFGVEFWTNDVGRDREAQQVVAFDALIEAPNHDAVGALGQGGDRQTRGP